MIENVNTPCMHQERIDNTIQNTSLPVSKAMNLSTNRFDVLNDKSEAKAFEQALTKFLRDALKVRRSQLVPAENVQRFRHGDDWSHPGLPNAYNAGMQQHSSEIVIKFDELVNHDLSTIPRYVGKLVEDLNAQFQRSMFATISATCDQSGNLVDASEAGGPIEGIAAMLEKIRFTADKHGKVQRPQIHMSPELIEKFREAQASAPPELLHRIQQLDELRTAEAIEEEIQRKARFVRYGETK